MVYLWYCPTVTPIVSGVLVYLRYCPTVAPTVSKVLIYLCFCPTVTPKVSKVLVYLRYCPKQKKQFQGQRTFPHPDPVTWNKLPHSARYAATKPQFKTQLKTTLFLSAHGPNSQISLFLLPIVPQPHHHFLLTCLYQCMHAAHMPVCVCAACERVCVCACVRGL